LTPPPYHRNGSGINTSLFFIKTWHKAIAKFAKVPNNAGASAIFKLLTARPQILEKRIKRPASAAAVSAAATVTDDLQDCTSTKSPAANNSRTTSTKRQRL
jgi:hypothetical protein